MARIRHSYADVIVILFLCKEVLLSLNEAKYRKIQTCGEQSSDGSTDVNVINSSTERCLFKCVAKCNLDARCRAFRYFKSGTCRLQTAVTAEECAMVTHPEAVESFVYERRPEQTIVCEGEQGTMACQDGRTIAVQETNYGRTAGVEVCPHSSTSDRNCRETTNSLKYTRDICEGKASCVIQPDGSILGDPCSGTYKYLNVTYTCN